MHDRSQALFAALWLCAALWIGTSADAAERRVSFDEGWRFLKSDAGQQKVADAIYRAIKTYKDEYEKLLNEGKEIGEKR